MDKDSQKYNYKLNNEIKYIDSGANTRIQFERIKTISSDNVIEYNKNTIVTNEVILVPCYLIIITGKINKSIYIQ